MHGYQGSDITVVCPNEVLVGKLLGSGSFASVYQVYPTRQQGENVYSSYQKMIRVANNELFQQLESFACGTVPSDDDEEDEEDEQQQRSSTITSISSTRHPKQPSYNCNNCFALKRAHIGTDYDKQRLNDCTNIMKQEVDILSQLPRHNNIIQLFGISANFNEEPTKGFIILQYLPVTLTDRLASWKMNQKLSRIKNPFKSYFFHRNSSEMEQQNVRLIQVCIGIANALSFLHHHNILYRDLKPENVGFDGYGNVRLFDFGLSRKISSSNNNASSSGKYYNNNNDSRKLTACVGSWRYMAPEVALGRIYDYSADIYSFSILMYEICTLHKPFSKIHNIDDMVRIVFVDSIRPSLRRIRSNSVKEVLKSCWDHNPECRPTFSYIINKLRNIRK